MMTKKRKKLRYVQSIEEKKCRKLLADVRACKRMSKYCEQIDALEAVFVLRMLRQRLVNDLSKAFDEWTKKTLANVFPGEAEEHDL